MTRITVEPPLYFDTDSEDHHAGYGLAQEVWFATGEGKSAQDAATLFSEVMMTAVLTESPECVAAMLHGAAQFMLEITPIPEISEVPHPRNAESGAQGLKWDAAAAEQQRQKSDEAARAGAILMMKRRTPAKLAGEKT